MAATPPEADPISEAIRFAEEYGYTNWSVAQDAYNRLRLKNLEMDRFIQSLVAQDRVTADELRGELGMEPYSS